MLRQKSLCFDCHSGLDPESPAYRQAGVFSIWIPAFAGMTTSELM
jgi:hypothetical protein